MEEQLANAMRRWLADPDKGFAIDRDAKVVHLSKVFDWFGKDFEAGGGTLEFIRPYLTPSDRVWLSTNKANARVEYLEYDWALNGLGQRSSP